MTLVVVLDTNALIRAALARTFAARALRLAWERGDFVLLTNEEILDEMARVLRYSRISEHYGLTEAAIQEFEVSVGLCRSSNSRKPRASPEPRP